MSDQSSSTPTSSKITADGLRYARKASGSMFGAGSTQGSATMSCFLCGKHRPRAELKNRRLLGRPHAVCKDGCEERG